MVCGRIEATMEEGHEDTDELVTIIMNPIHAKLVWRAFEASIKSYEEKNGEIIIPLPEEIPPPIEEKQVLASAALRKKK